MRDEDHGRSGHPPDVEKQIVHFEPGEFIERAERLVHQQNGRLMNDRTAQRYPLLHAAGQLPRIGLLKTTQADELENSHVPALSPWRRSGEELPSDRAHY